MIEQIPLAFIVDDTMVVRPTTVIVLGHNQSLILVGAHGVLTHGIAQHLSILPNVWIGKVIVAIILKGERTLCLTTWQAFQTIDTIHLKLAIAPLNFFLWGIIGKILHVRLQFRTTTSTPEDVGIAVRSQKHTRVDTIDALDIFRLRYERTLWTICDGYTDTKAHATLRRRREVKIVLAITFDTIRRPHRIRVRTHPRHFVLGNNHTVVSPVGEIL